MCAEVFNDVVSIKLRLTAVERTNRRLQAAFAGGLCIGIVALMMGQSAPAKQNDSDTICARRFVVLDANGNKCAVLGLESGSHPTSWRLARNAVTTNRIALATPGLFLYSSKSTLPCAELSLGDVDGVPTGVLALQSTNEPFSKEVDKVILTNRYFLNGGPVLQLQKSGWDQDGIELGFRRQDSFGLNIRRRVELPKRAVELDGKVVKLADVSTPEKMEAFQAAEEKADAIKLEVSSDGNSSINMTDKSGKKRAELWTDEDAAYLQILDANANPRATVGTAHVVKPDGSRITFPEASLLLCDPEGKTIWHAP